MGVLETRRRDAKSRSSATTKWSTFMYIEVEVLQGSRGRMSKSDCRGENVSIPLLSFPSVAEALPGSLVQPYDNSKGPEKFDYSKLNPIGGLAWGVYLTP